MPRKFRFSPPIDDTLPSGVYEGFVPCWQKPLLLKNSEVLDFSAGSLRIAKSSAFKA
ncbi:MAG: hypothetical protein F6J93_08815 [Oscillatoria sp. SIO1A7]|nr:hypothetical protein [Oscillatoria sp. SIO1A7]